MSKTRIETWRETNGKKGINTVHVTACLHVIVHYWIAFAYFFSMNTANSMN